MYAQALEDILQDRCTPAAIRGIESGSAVHELAATLEESGFSMLLVPEAQGGAGASWAEFHDIAALCGAHALPLPLAQTIAVRGLLQQPDAAPSGMLAALAPALTRDPAGELQARHVPFGRVASHVLGAIDGELMLLPTRAAQCQPTGVHGSLVASLRWKQADAQRVDTRVDAARLMPLAALIHAAMLAGAMKKAFDLTMAYANERVQFGKPIGKFQAIQHQLSVMAEHVAAAAMAAQAAFFSTTEEAPGVPSTTACAIAKARASEAVQVVAPIAHAVHGAIGVTEEYDLQLYTRRLHEWRLAHGSEAYWNRELGRMALQGSEPLFADFVRGLV